MNDLRRWRTVIEAVELHPDVQRLMDDARAAGYTVTLKQVSPDIEDIPTEQRLEIHNLDKRSKTGAIKLGIAAMLRNGKFQGAWRTDIEVQLAQRIRNIATVREILHLA